MVWLLLVDIIDFFFFITDVYRIPKEQNIPKSRRSLSIKSAEQTAQCYVRSVFGLVLGSFPLSLMILAASLRCLGFSGPVSPSLSM